MSVPLTIASIDELHQHQADVLTTINAAPQGAELFLADPFRFLSEHGYTIPSALQAQLQNRASALTKSPTALYDRIAAGSASLLGGPAAGITWHITDLGVTL